MLTILRAPAASRSLHPLCHSRHARGLASWTQTLKKHPFQIYISTSRDPYLNLSLEHHLFTHCPPSSKILFQYVNRPCIVTGRNQNPWVEVNLALVHFSGDADGKGKVDLVRRRSGGGTVFHDEGNVNWSVTCDFTEFTRDKHAEMVVRALRELGVERARVNERHDIVLDQGADASNPEWDGKDTHATPFTTQDVRPRKVSGSAYKMARNRALHHGTALLTSPNLGLIGRYLNSPAKQHISAKGVESVPSPVTNIGLGNEEFMKKVREQFRELYRVPDAVGEVLVSGEEAMEVDEIRKGIEELKGKEWTYCQTPGFTFSTEPVTDLNQSASDHPRLTFEAKHGVITDATWTPSGENEKNEGITKKLRKALEGVRIHEQTDWRPLLRDHVPAGDCEDVAEFLARMFPPPPR